MLIFPTVVIGLEAVYGRPYARAAGARHRVVLRLRHLLAAGGLARRPLEPPQHDGGVLHRLRPEPAPRAALAPNFIALAVALFALGMFAAIYHPVGTAIVVAAATNRGRTLAFNGVCGNIGVALAAGITAALTAWIGWRGAFLVPGRGLRRDRHRLSRDGAGRPQARGRPQLRARTCGWRCG